MGAVEKCLALVYLLLNVCYCSSPVTETETVLPAIVSKGTFHACIQNVICDTRMHAHFSKRVYGSLQEAYIWAFISHIPALEFMQISGP